MRLFKTSIEELRSDLVLQFYGVSLAMAHWVTIAFWLPKARNNLAEPICWPYFQSCEKWAQMVAPSITWVLMIYGFLAFLAVGGFLCRNISFGYWSLLAASIFKFILFSLSYRFMGNYHYMMFLVTFVFLFWPAKKVCIGFLMVGFYLSAASLKLNPEWLSGANLVGPLPFGEPWKSWSLAAVIPLELVVSSFFLFGHPWFFWAGAISFIGFHLISWFVVGFFYPTIMFLLLSVYFLNRFLQKQTNFFRMFQASSHKTAVVIFLGLFTLAQAVPYFKSGDTALTGEGRIFALNMLDATSECQNFTVSRYQGFSTVGRLETPRLGVRIRCDPIVFYQSLKQACRKNLLEPAFVDMDFALLARRSTDSRWTEIVRQVGVCRNPLKLSIWPINDWIEFKPKRAVASALKPWPTSVLFQDNFGSKMNSSQISVFRGDLERTGHSAHSGPLFLRKKWTEKFRVPNGNIGVHRAAKSTPAVDDSGIYIGGDSGWFFAYSWSGQLLWKIHFDQTGQGIHSTAALDEQSVYVGTYDGRMYRLDKVTGAVEWVIDLGDAIGASPGLWEQSVFVNVETRQPNGYLARLDRKTGEIEWASQWLGQQSHSSPTLATDQGLVLIGDNASFTRAFDLWTGSQVWEKAMAGEIKSTLVVHQNAVFVTGRNNKTMALDLKTGRELWSFPIESGTRSSPALWSKKGMLISSDEAGHLYGLDLKKGRLIWKQTPSVTHSTPSSPVIIDNQFGIYICGPKQICFFNDKGQTVNQISTQARVSSTPVLFNSHLVISEDHPGDLVVFTQEINPSKSKPSSSAE